jgi:hypothetical protein
MLNGKVKVQKVEVDSEGSPHAPRHAAKQYKAEKVWPTNRRTKVRPKILISQSRASNTRSTFGSTHVIALSLSYYQLAIKTKKEDQDAGYNSRNCAGPDLGPYL